MNENLNQHVQQLIAEASKMKMDGPSNASTFMCSEQDSTSSEKYMDENDWEEEVIKFNSSITA